MFVYKLAIQYFIWHYTQAIEDLWRIWMNIIWFITQFFSLSLLVKTLFAPWRRMNEEQRDGFHPQAFLETLMVNIMMRIIGFFIRLVFLVVGICALLLTVVLDVCFMVSWIFMPALIIGLFALGFSFLFYNAVRI